MPPADTNEFLLYRDVFGAWRWEWRDLHGDMRDSRHAYGTRSEAVAAARAAGLIRDDSMSAMPKVADPYVGASVLCVHSDSAAREFLQHALSPSHVCLAPNGYEALKSINTVAFDAYVVDYWLPDWTGVNLCREIRKTDANVPICMYTKAQSPDAQRRALRAGANIYLTMPQAADAVRERLGTLLRGRQENGERAWLAAEGAIQAELDRHASLIRGVDAKRPAMSSQLVERKLKLKAMKAFLNAGGTRANFERKWAKFYTKIAQGLVSGTAQAA